MSFYQIHEFRPSPDSSSQYLACTYNSPMGSRPVHLQSLQQQSTSCNLALPCSAGRIHSLFYPTLWVSLWQRKFFADKLMTRTSSSLDINGRGLLHICFAILAIISNETGWETMVQPCWSVGGLEKLQHRFRTFFISEISYGLSNRGETKHKTTVYCFPTLVYYISWCLSGNINTS